MMRPTEPWSELFVDPRAFTRREDLPDPKTLRIYDTTLRDGEQMPGVALSPQNKYLVLKELSSIGCHVVELTFPVIAESEHELLRLAARGKAKGEIREDLDISVMCRSSEKDIDRTIAIVTKAGFPLDQITFLLFTSASDLHVKYKLGAMLLKREGMSPDDLATAPMSIFQDANRRMVSHTVRYAVDRGVRRIEFGAEDSSRTPIEQLVDLCRAAIDAGAFRLIFADTTGSLSPESTRRYCSALAQAFPGVERVTHFHDDFGLATANVLMGVLNGFPIFTTTLNGLGERAGNAPLHTVVAALRYLYGLEIDGFQYQRLNQVCGLVERLTGIPVAVKEPVIGRNVFAHESGIHTHGVSVHRAMYEPIPYEEVGGIPRFVYGKHSGSARLQQLLEDRQSEIGLPVNRELVFTVLDEIKRLRQTRISEIETSEAIRAYYSNLDRLGLAEEEVVGLARQVARVESLRQLVAR